MSKVLVKSNRTGVLTLCAQDGEHSVRCILHQGDNKLDADAWEKVKRQDAVKNLLESKAIEEKGEVKEAAKPAAKPVADQAPEQEQAEEQAQDSEETEQE